MFSTIFLWALLGLSGASMLAVVSRVGKDRGPLTPADAVGALAIGTLQFCGLVYVLLNR